MLYTIENEHLVCRIDSHGCEIKSVKDKETGREYMWSGDPKYWNRTSPVLFPFVGAVKDKEYRHEGRTYNIGQHGFARDMEFALLSNTDCEIWMELGESEETMAKYPFRFRLDIGYKLVGRELDVMWHVINTGDRIMYFSIGAHPGFMLPRDDKAAFMLYDSKNRPVSSIRNRVFGTGGCVTGKVQEIDTPEGKLPITEHLFDGDALVLEDEQLGCVEIVPDRSKEPVIRVTFTSPLVGLWSPPQKNAPFVCIEPWYGRCDMENFDGELSEREYEQMLNAGGDFRAKYSIGFVCK
jgi:galactose mutarotase-like enzyme